MTAIDLATPLANLYGWPLFFYILGVISITRLITLDSLVDKWRERFFQHWPHEGFQTKKRPKRGEFTTISGAVYYVNIGTKLGELIHCPWCTSYWVAAGLWGVFAFWPVATTFFLVPLGVRILAGAFMAWTD